MKKIFLGFAVVATLASCTKNENIDNSGIDGKSDLNRISFQTTTGAAVRGAVANPTTLQNLANGFEVIAISNFGDARAASLFGANDAAYKNNYKYTSANAQKWDWVNSTDKDWPTDVAKYPLQFFAANPFPAGLTWDSPIKTFTPEGAVADQNDQLAAKVAVTTKPISGTAPMDFQHILSAIQFKLMSSNAYVVNIKEISIVNVTESRDFDYSKGTWAALTANQVKKYDYFASTNATSTQTLTFATPAVALAIKSGSFADVAITDAGQLMLVPQAANPTDLAGFVTAAEAWVNGGKSGAFPNDAAKTALGKGAYLQVTYNMSNGTDYIIGKAGNYVRVLFPLDLTEAKTAQWDMSKRYTYTLFLGTPDSSNGTVMDPDYKGEDGGNTGTEVDNPKVDPGKPVIKGKITFEVKVSDWTEANGGDIK